MKPAKPIKLFATQRNALENRTTALVTAAMGAALAIVLSIIGLYMPLLSIVVLLLIPVPIAYLAVTQRFAWAVMVSVVVMLIDSMLFGVVSGAFVCSTFCGLGLVIGYGYRQEYSAGSILLAGTIVALLTILLQLGAAAAMVGMDPAVFMGEISPDMQQQMDSLLSSVYSGQELEMARQQSTEMLKMVMRALPFSFLVMAAFDAWASMILARKVFEKMGAHWVPHFPPFEQWKLPAAIIYIYLGAIIVQMVMTYVVHYWPDVGDTVMLNISLVAMWLLWIQGIVCLWRYRHTKPYLRTLRWILLVFSFIVPLVQYCIAGLGAWDILKTDPRLSTGDK
jgi:uncharacterized protein YybS (DUF2232 family)